MDDDYRPHHAVILMVMLLGLFAVGLCFALIIIDFIQALPEPYRDPAPPTTASATAS